MCAACWCRHPAKALVLDMDLKVSSGKPVNIWAIWRKNFRFYGNLTVEQNLRFLRRLRFCGAAQNEKFSMKVKRLV